MNRLRIAAVLVLAACATVHPAPVALAVEPTSAAISPAGSILFQAVLGQVTTAAAWSVTPSTGCGSINSSTGAYTAPACPSPLPSSGSYSASCTVTATEGGQTASSAVTVADVPVSIVVSPATTTIQPGALATFTASVHWSCGEVTH